MTTADTDFNHDFLVDRPLPGVQTLRRVTSAVRNYVEGRRRIRSVRHLSDHMLRDIGIDPQSIREVYPSIAPKLDWLPDRRRVRQ
jgi:uncharacterized protein YjiS (DUF1127 family)